MKQNLLGKHFILTPTWIALRRKRITEADFRYSVIEFLEADLHRRSRLGDLLIKYREAFGKERLRQTLIPEVCARLLISKKTCENSMSLAKAYPPRDRIAIVSDSHMEELLSLKNERSRAKLLTKVARERKAGRNVTLRELRKEVRRQKDRTGQRIIRGRRPKP
jgi:hypothetical protein